MSSIQSNILEIKVNSINFKTLVIDNGNDPIPQYPFHLFCPKSLMLVFPNDPKDLLEVLKKVNSTRGMFTSLSKMYDALLTDGLNHQARDLDAQVDKNVVPEVVVYTGIIEEYADAGKTKEALTVFKRMLFFDITPNAYTYSMVIKALSADPDPSSLVVAKELVMEMMGKGMQPNARTYTAVFEGFAGHEKMEEAKQFLEEIKANGFVADRKAMKAMRHVLKGSKVHVVKSISGILFDDPEDYSDYSDDDDDAIKKFVKKMDWPRCPPNSYLSFCKKHIIEDNPQNPKDLEDVFDTMRKVEPVTITMFRMVNMLKKDGFMSQAKEIFLKMDLAHDIPEVVTHTGVVEIYAKAYEAKEALKVFLHMLSFGVTPNAYTYSVLIKGLAKDPHFLGDAKKYTLEMMDKGMQPNARTCIAMFKAFARLKDFKVEKGK